MAGTITNQNHHKMRIQKVRFAKYRGEIIAIFQQDSLLKAKGRVECYTHVGQHSYGFKGYFKGMKSATYSEYQHLLRELVVQVGYKNLEITNRQKITAHRPPTKGEILFGHGVTHYRDFTAAEIGINSKGQLNGMFKADDGLFYSLR